MKISMAILLALGTLAADDALAQRTRVTVSDGAVTSSRAVRRDASRLSSSIPGVAEELRARLRISGDSAQRIALDDFGWRGRVSSVEVDEQDARLFWDVKVVPDSARATVVRYRIDATNGGILDIREFSGVAGSARTPPR